MAKKPDPKTPPTKKKKAPIKRSKGNTKAPKASKASPVIGGLPAIIPKPLSEFEKNQREIEQSGVQDHEMFNLTPQQAKFARRWMLDHNGTKAAIEVGYSKDTAAEQASRLLRNVKMKEYIEFLRAPLLQKWQISQDIIIQELTKIAKFNISDYTTVQYNEETGEHERYVDLGRVGHEDMAALASLEIIDLPPVGPEGNQRAVIKTKIKGYDKVKALEILGKRYGVLREDQNVINVTNNVVVDSEAMVKRAAFLLAAANRGK